MLKKRKVGLLLILIGIGIPLILFFFQDDGGILLTRKKAKVIHRNLNQSEISYLQKQLYKRKHPEKDPDDVKDADDFVAWLESREYKADEMFISMWTSKEGNTKNRWTIVTGRDVHIPFRPFIGIGIFFVLLGIGIFMFSFFPKPEIKRKA